MALAKQEQHANMFTYYKKLICLRKSEAALHQLDRSHINVLADETRQTLQVHRWHDGEHVICLLNFSKQPQNLLLPAVNNEWTLLLSSADAEWYGPGKALTQVDKGGQIVVEPEFVALYKCSQEESNNVS